LISGLTRVLYYLSRSMRRPYWSHEELREYQEKRLRDIVRHAYEYVPLYHDRFKAAGIVPSDIKSIEDLDKIPIIRKEEFKKQDPSRLVSSRFDIAKLKIIRTSGSTGKPFQIYVSPVEDSWRKAIYMRANISCGQRMRDEWVVVTSPHHFTDTTGLQRRIKIYAQTCVSVFDKIDEQVKTISRMGPDVLDGYSGSLVLIAKEIKRSGTNDIRPRMMFGSAELIDDVSRRFIEEVFHAPFYDQFGCAEVDRTAWQCPSKTGYHMDIDSVVTQATDADGNSVSPGERGEIVYTSLFNYAMPIIRYCVGDLAISLDDECPCGRSFPMLKSIEGRKDSLLRLPDGRLMSPRAFTVSLLEFGLYDQIKQFRIVQKELGLFKIYIQPEGQNIDSKILSERLRTHLQEGLNLKDSEVQIDVEFTDEMPVDKTGKHRAVISEI
jgi:phenylacetate-CoA ligase